VTHQLALPAGSDARKGIPMARGLLDYFPAALAAVAAVSKAGNDKHNPGQAEMTHARGKSMDHADCIIRHLADRGLLDPEDNLRHSAKLAWRALALLQEELELAGEASLPRAARLPKPFPDDSHFDIEIRGIEAPDPETFIRPERPDTVYGAEIHVEADGVSRWCYADELIGINAGHGSHVLDAGCRPVFVRERGR
jgi:dATP/dGTP diphosphohydrolase